MSFYQITEKLEKLFCIDFIDFEVLKILTLCQYFDQIQTFNGFSVTFVNF